MSPVRDSIGFFDLRAGPLEACADYLRSAVSYKKGRCGDGPRKGEKARAGNKPGSVVDNHSSGTIVTDRL